MVRRILMLVLVLTCSIASAAAGDPEQAAAARGAPNVLLILADDMGFSDAGCYGGEIRTPHLDSLAADGLRFTQFYNTARCWPSRAAVLTGYYAQQVRRDALPGGPRAGNQGGRPAWAPLLPALLRPLGYRSYHSGKWHIDGQPLANGFDRAYTLDDHDRYFHPQRQVEDGRPLPPVEPGTDFYVTTAIADHAIKCLQEHAQEHGDQPFFHYLCFTAPHFPLHALQEDIDRYRQMYRKGWDAVRKDRSRRLKELGIAGNDLPDLEVEVGPPYAFPNLPERLGPGEVFRPLPWSELDEQQREFQAAKMAVHAAMVDRMDQEIGRVLQQLRQMDALENTLILFASDNGASAEIMIRGDGHDPQAAAGSAASYLCLGPGWSTAANTPLRRHKTWVHEGGIATPLIAHWPRGIAARGELRHNPAHLIDIVPTVMQLAGSAPPERWQDRPVPPPPGRSLVPVFASDRSVARDSLWWLHEGHRAIRAGDWKLVAARGDEWELYDLSRDRGETRNLAEQHPDKVRQLQTLWQQQTDAFLALAQQDLPPDPPAKKQPAGKKKPTGKNQPQRTADAADSADVRVMSFNIRYGTASDGDNHWNRRKEFLVETIRAYNPDLLGTQETLGFQRDYLAEHLPEYDQLGVGRDDGGQSGEMMALFYRRDRFEKLDGGHFWLSETPDQVGSKSWDSSLPRMVTWVKLRERRQPDAKPLLFFNTHFDHRGPVARLESARLVRRQAAAMGAGCAVIVTGDFNAGENSEPYRALFGQQGGEASPLVDSYRVAHPEPGEAEGTFSGFKAEATGGARIDWIAVSREWKIVQANIDRTARDGRTPSDHFPVTAVLRLPAGD